MICQVKLVIKVGEINIIASDNKWESVVFREESQ